VSVRGWRALRWRWVAVGGGGWRWSWRCLQFAHLHVDDAAVCNETRLAWAMALIPIGFGTKRPTLDACHHVEHGDGKGARNHEEQGHRHAEQRQHEKQRAA